MVESSLKSKLKLFPKLTNKDTKQLYEPANILAEMQKLEQNSDFKALLSYFDSSSDVLLIDRRLPIIYRRNKLSGHQTTREYLKYHCHHFPTFWNMSKK